MTKRTSETFVYLNDWLMLEGTDYEMGKNGEPRLVPDLKAEAGSTVEVLTLFENRLPRRRLWIVQEDGSLKLTERRRWSPSTPRVCDRMILRLRRERRAAQQAREGTGPTLAERVQALMKEEVKDDQ